MSFLRNLLRWDHSTDWWTVGAILGLLALELARLHAPAPKPAEMPAASGPTMPA